MDNNNEKAKALLSEYLYEQFKTALVGGFADRIALANEFINCFDGARFAGKAVKTTPLLSVDTIEMIKVDGGDEDSAEYTFEFAKEYSGDEREKFTNYSFGPARLFEKKKLFGVHPTTVGEVMREFTEADVCQILAKIAFNICFCVHPFKGLKYFGKLTVSEDEEKEFFKKEYKHVFDLEDNPNRFLNGYQESAFYLWGVLNDSQKDFINRALYGKITAYDEFFEGWKQNFAIYKSECKAPCGEIIPAMVFKDETALLYTERWITVKRMYCYRCKNVIGDKCKACKIDASKQYAEFLTLKLKVAKINQDGEEDKDFAKEIVVCDKKQISLNSLNGEEKHVYDFEIIMSKKANVLGAKVLLTEPVTAIHGAKTRDYKQGEIIGLLPGMVIKVGDITLTVPGEPPKPPQPQKPKAEPPKPTDTDVKTDTDGGESQENPEKATGDTEEKQVEQPEVAPSAEDKAEVKAEVKPESKPEVKPAPPKQRAVKVKSILEKHEIPEELLVVADGQLFRVDAQLGDYRGYSVYRLNGGEKHYRLVVIDGDFARDALVNLESVINFDLNGNGGFLAPLAIADGVGFCKGKVGYVTEQVENLLPAAVILNGRAKLSKANIVRSFKDIFEVVKRVHDKGYAFKNLSLKNFYVVDRIGKIILANTHYLSREDAPVYATELEFAPDEIACSMTKQDCISDVYSIAQIFFQIFVGDSDFSREDYFGVKSGIGSFFGSLIGAKTERWKSEMPDYVADMLIKTFTTGVCDPQYKNFNSEEKIQEQNRILRDRQLRPTADDYRRALDRWISQEFPQSERPQEKGEYKVTDGMGLVYTVGEKTRQTDSEIWYKVTQKSSGKEFVLKCEKATAIAYYNNLKEMVAKGAPSKAFEWPISVVKMKNEVVGRIVEVDDGRFSTFADIISGKATFVSDEVLVKALLNLATAIDRLHASGYSYRDITDKTVKFDIQTGDIKIAHSGRIAPEGIDFGMVRSALFVAPEVAIKENKADKYSDRFAIGVIAFALLTGCHPFFGKLSVNENGEIVCKNKPDYKTFKEYIALSQMETVALSPTWQKVPEVIKKTFEKTFTATRTDGRKKEIESDRSQRSSANDWRKKLEKWLKELKENR
ncbi:MAG: hypothetical protein IJY84_01780 [Clostridia bacterium]|nr:hypothetical protein [Clostridia bacterium]